MEQNQRTIVKHQPTWIESAQQSLQYNLNISSQKKDGPKPKRVSSDKYNYKGLITDRPHITIIAGKKGSGKSYLCCKLLLTSWRYKYDKVIFISPTFRAQYDKLWSKLSPEGITVHDTLTECFINKLMETLSSCKNANSTLLILDDLGEEFRKICPRVVNMLVSNSRHYRLSIVCLHQRLTQSPPIMRANADCIIAFSACSYTETEALWKMVATVPRKEFQHMFNSATQKPHSFLVSMVDSGGRLRHYHMDFMTEIKPIIK